ncbi:MAG: SMC-Scp complex subunit ScpB [Candidatus Paceibacterota bacterium]
MDLSAKIEALLFYKSEPMSHQILERLLGISRDELKKALPVLEERLSGHGITLIQNDKEVSLATDREMSELIEDLTKEEREKDLGKASLETLTIVLYKGPVSKAQIDYIRGVNSSFILRNLLIRGLVERVPHKLDKRAYVYSPTTELFSYLGISKKNELPEFSTVQEEIAHFEKNFKKEEDKNES